MTILVQLGLALLVHLGPTLLQLLLLHVCTHDMHHLPWDEWEVGGGEGGYSTGPGRWLRRQDCYRLAINVPAECRHRASF